MNKRNRNSITYDEIIGLHNLGGRSDSLGHWFVMTFHVIYATRHKVYKFSKILARQKSFLMYSYYVSHMYFIYHARTRQSHTHHLIYSVCVQITHASQNILLYLVILSHFTYSSITLHFTTLTCHINERCIIRYSYAYAIHIWSVINLRLPRPASSRPALSSLYKDI